MHVNTFLMLRDVEPKSQYPAWRFHPTGCLYANVQRKRTASTHSDINVRFHQDSAQINSLRCVRIQR